MEPDVWVQPTYVVTVAADEITRSPLHTCGADAEGIGYALRFPRVQGFLRADKRPEDANTVQDIIALYEQQRRLTMGRIRVRARAVAENRQVPGGLTPKKPLS